MGKNIINIALFGLGRIGQMHAENLINHKDFNLKYIFDKDKKLIKKLSKKYKKYSWHKNAGYGTNEHLKAIKKYGLTKYHRKTFSPIHNILSP